MYQRILTKFGLSSAFALSLGCLAFSTSGVEGRTWTNSEGKTIEADYISHSGDSVTLKLKGKEIQYPLEKLSQGDRDWLKEQEAKLEEDKKKRQEEVASLLGRRDRVSISHRLFEDTGDYFKESTRRTWLKEHEGGAFDSTGKEDDWLRRDPAKDQCLIYCPESYDGTEAYGLLLFINPMPNALIRKDWEPILSKYKLIAVSAYGVGNYADKDRKKINPHPYRVTLSLDAMATVEKQYKIDPKRRYVSGTSGGGHMAFTTAALYPELFKGAISSAAQSYLPSHFPGFEIKDFKRGERKDMKWIVVSGKKDYNYNKILETSKDWESNRLNYRFLDVPDMGHAPPAAGPLEESLQWIGL
ncbi:Putative esterase [Rubritalea squalenifaciens DSM 18772]|uniref:Putative esterase n=1 Tax=Rubritalea squalenifaciens DSM 18772 TaxID=1123071 RepID=A0A1M6J955_9BACT|nr:alpha/beta hydrolase-fold protein [Rubritalea squalenifaciens]SHJ43170.1 Putative esterase [Rubritalea squalenifaciens DSM 18772]